MDGIKKSKRQRASSAVTAKNHRAKSAEQNNVDKNKSAHDDNKKISDYSNQPAVLILTIIILAVAILFWWTNNNPKRTDSQISNPGSDSANTQLVAGFPNDVPVYPGAKLTTSNKNSNQAYSATYSTDDEYEKVVAFYSDSLKASGWKESTAGKPISFNFGRVFSSTKDDRNMILIITMPNNSISTTGVTMTISGNGTTSLQ